MKVRYHIFFEGRVQGVFFRAYTRDMARRKGVFGWVKNLPDGRVEAVMEGEEEKINDVVYHCVNRHPHAKVIGYEKEKENFTGEFREFSIIY